MEKVDMLTKAEELLTNLPMNEWISFSEIPKEYHEGIIQVSDSFIWKQRKIEFNDDDTAFRIKSA